MRTPPFEYSTGDVSNIALPMPLTLSTNAGKSVTVDSSRDLREVDLGPDTLLSFVHIPKTGGTTLYHYLDTKFLPHQVFPADRAEWHGEQMCRMDPKWINKFQCIRGHFGCEQLGPLLKACWKKIVRFTVIRHPEAQILSEFHMLRTDTNAWPHAEAVDSNLSLEEFLEMPMVFSTMSGPQLMPNQRPGNRQCAHLLLQEHENPFLLPEDEWLPRLFETLERYLLVGLQDQLLPAVQLLAALLGWECPATLPHANVSVGRKPALTDEQRRRLQQLNPLDFALYDWAAHRFGRQFTVLLSQLGYVGGEQPDPVEVSRRITCRSEQRRASRLGTASHNPDFCEVVDAAGLLLGHVSRDYNRQLNWIGPEQKATIRLCFSTPGARVIRIELLYWLTPRMLNDFYILVNGQPIQMTRYQETHTTNFVGYLPDYLIGTPGQVVEIELGTSGVSTPAELALNRYDHERKCVALAAVNCYPATAVQLGGGDG